MMLSATKSQLAAQNSQHSNETSVSQLPETCNANNDEVSDLLSHDSDQAGMQSFQMHDSAAGTFMQANVNLAGYENDINYDHEEDAQVDNEGDEIIEAAVLENARDNEVLPAVKEPAIIPQSHPLLGLWKGKFVVIGVKGYHTIVVAA